MKNDPITLDLFESGSPPQHHIAERSESIRRLREGMSRAEKNAEEQAKGWGARALDYVKRYAQLHPSFLAEDCRHWAEFTGLDEPPHARAWGPLMLRAEKLKIVRRVGMGRAADANQAWVIKWAAV